MLHLASFKLIRSFLLVASGILIISGPMYAQCWNLIWEDEFEGNSLNLNKWSYQIGGQGWGNNELQFYTAGPNIEVSDGTLKIIAKEDLNNGYPNNDYTSSRIRSIDQGDWRYGKMEARIRMPIGQGIWPAFWMMPTESVYGGWPASGEIDIMEYLGHQPSTIHGTCHYGFAWDNKGSSGNFTNLPSGNFHEAFHLFSIEWEPDEIRWYLDGQLYHQITADHPDFEVFNWPFDQKFHFILNVAVGGNWPGSPDATTLFPQTMEVDWVRTYQRFEDLAISGPTLIEPYTSGITYQLPDIPGASYSWTVPENATILSGETSPQVQIDWSFNGGDVQVDLLTDCGTQTFTLPVTISPNRWMNHDFEENFRLWSQNQFEGASANFFIETESPYAGVNSACVEVLSTSNDLWHIQLGRSDVDLSAGENYTLSFWAKADQAGQDINIAFIDANDFSFFDGTGFTLTEDWSKYTFSFTAPQTAAAFFNIDLADEAGIFCFDEFSFARTSLLTNRSEPVQTVADITVFPNPFDEKIFASGSNIEEVTLWDVNGRLIHRFQILPDQLEHPIVTNTLVSGIYLVKVSSRNTVHTFRMVKP